MIRPGDKVRVDFDRGFFTDATTGESFFVPSRGRRVARVLAVYEARSECGRWGNVFIAIVDRLGRVVDTCNPVCVHPY